MSDSLPPYPPDVDDDGAAWVARLPDLLRHYRKLARLTQSDVDRYYDVDESQLSDLERGTVKRPRNDTLWKLALAYSSAIKGMSADKIYTHLLEARDQKPAEAHYDARETTTVDRIRAYPAPVRRVAWPLVGEVLDGIEELSQLFRREDG